MALTDGLQRYWACDSAPSNILQDGVTPGGTQTAPFDSFPRSNTPAGAPAPAIVGGALRGPAIFNHAYTLPSTWTVSMLVKNPNQTATPLYVPTGTYLSYLMAYGVFGTSNGIGWQRTTGGNNFIFYYDGTSESDSSVIPDVSDFVHVIVTFNAGNVAFFINGTAAGTTSGKSNQPEFAYINEAFDGFASSTADLKRIGVWNRVLTTDEIADLTDNEGALLSDPSIESVDPASGTEDGGTEITITGTEFRDGSTVTIGGEPATDVEFVSDTELTAVTPAGSAGTVDVVVTNPDDQTGTLAEAFLYTHAELTPEAGAMIKLLPPGVLWLLEIGSHLRNLLRGIADEFKRIRLRGVDLINESDPRTASETLEDWERVLSLPDDLVTSIPGTTAGRRVAITQKYIGRGGSNDEFYEELCAACGYPLLSITRHAEDVLRSGTAQSGDVVVGIADAYTITLELDTPTAGALTEAQFEAVVRNATHSHIQVVFTY